MENYHIDIWEKILFRLPFTAALQDKQVCKTWKTLLANRRYSEGGFLVSCCLAGNNEVQLYYGEQYERTLLWQIHKRGSSRCWILQWSGEYVFVPRSDHDLQRRAGQLEHLKSVTSWWTRLLNRHAWVTDGFGYCQSTNKYKIVRIYYRERGVGDVLVYTIGGREWRNVGTVLHDIRSSRGVFANGVLHWLNSDVTEQKVFGFDLEDENIRLLPMPPRDLYCEPFGNNRLKLLGGNLCFVRRDFDDCMEIWAFKRNKNTTAEHFQTSFSYYDNNSWNWIKEFSIESMDVHLFEPFAVTRSNQVLLCHKINTLYSYDPEAST